MNYARRCIMHNDQRMEGGSGICFGEVKTLYSDCQRRLVWGASSLCRQVIWMVFWWPNNASTLRSWRQIIILLYSRTGTTLPRSTSTSRFWRSGIDKADSHLSTIKWSNATRHVRHFYILTFFQLFPPGAGSTSKMRFVRVGSSLFYRKYYHNK